MDTKLFTLINALYFVTGIHCSLVELVASETPVLNESLILTCAYTGNITVDYFVWNFMNHAQRDNLFIRMNSCQPIQHFDADITYFAYELQCKDANTNLLIIDHLPYMHFATMACTAMTKDQNISSESVSLYTYIPVTEVILRGQFEVLSSVLHIKENDMVQLECLASGSSLPEIRWFNDNGTLLDYTDDIRITDNLTSWMMAEWESVTEWSMFSYTAKRNDNGVSIYCTGNNTANRYPVMSALKPMMIVQVTHCLEENDIIRKYHWNNTSLGKNVSVSCSSFFTDMVGIVSRQCSEKGMWMQPIYDCLRTDVAEIQNIVDTIDGNSSEEIEYMLQKATEVTTYHDQNRTLNNKEFSVIYKALEQTVNLNDWNVTRNQSVNFLKTVSNLVETKYTMLQEQHNMKIDIINPLCTKENIGTRKLLDIVSAFTTVLGRTLDQTDPDIGITIQNENILLQVKRINNSEGIIFPDVEKYPNLAQIAIIQLPAHSVKGSTLFYGVLFKNISLLLTSEATNESLQGGGLLNSAVIGARLNNWRQNSGFSVTIHLQHLKKVDGSGICSFMTENSTRWMGDGCYVKGSSSTRTTCECNHLTNFAILMSPWTSNNVETETLRVITIAGCSLSFLGLLITMVVHSYLWRYMKSDRVVILMNLCVAMVASYAIFLGGVDRTENKGVCTGMAALLQYIYLVVFFLMLVEGIEISFAALFVFATKPKIKWMLSAAWVIPAIIVGITLAVTKTRGYGSDHFCWLSIDSGLIWTFVGPTLVIILINIMLLGFVIRAVLRVKKMSQKRALSKTIAGIRCLCILLPLLGCTWVIGIFYVNKATSWIQYIFSVCNGCQGVVIFIFHCALNKQITNAYKKKQKRSSNSYETSSNLHLLAQTKNFIKYLSSIALYLVISDTRHTNLYPQDKGFAENDDNFNNIAMKSFGPMKTNDEKDSYRL